MKRLLHIVAKDFRGLRDRWVYWVGAMAIKTVAALWLVWGHGVDETAYDYICKSLLVLVPAELALTFLLTALIVQADPLAGEPPFWRTRPVSGLRMLAAKLLSLFLLLGLPVCVVALPWWLACGADIGNIAAAAALMLVLQAVIIAPAVLVASLTDSLGRFLVWSLVLVMAQVVAVGPISLARTASADPALNATRVAVYCGVLVTTGAVVILLQYLSGNRRRSLGVLGGGAALAIAGWMWWPWSVDLGRWGASPGERVDASKIHVAIDGARLSTHVPRASNQTVYGTLYTQLQISGAPENAHLAGLRSEHLWRWPDGTELRRTGWGVSGYLPMIDSVRRELHLPETTEEAARRARYPDWGKPEVGVSLPRDRLEKLQGDPARYELTVELVAQRPHVTQEVPLQVAGWRASNGRGVRVLQISPGTAKNMGTLAYLQAELPTGIADGLRTPFSGARTDYGAPTLFWVDRTTGRFKPLGPRLSAIRWPIAGVTLSMPLVSVDAPDLRDAAARGFSLVWVAWEDSAPFTRTTSTERFEVK